jgi:hypothetical protein
MRPFKAPGSQIKLSEDDPEKYSSTAVRETQGETERHSKIDAEAGIERNVCCALMSSITARRTRAEAGRAGYAVQGAGQPDQAVRGRSGALLLDSGVCVLCVFLCVFFVCLNSVC